MEKKGCVISFVVVRVASRRENKVPDKIELGFCEFELDQLSVQDSKLLVWGNLGILVSAGRAGH
jgi:hypothetical protein